METRSKKKLLLITAGFPFGESERSFLLTEFTRLQETFDITVLAMDVKLPVIYPIPEGIRVERYVLPPLRNAGSLRGLRGLCGREAAAEIKAAVKGCGGRLAAKRITRIAAGWLNARQAKLKLRELVQQEKIDIIYSYWCTDMTIGAVLLKEEYPNLKVVTRFHGIDLYRERNAIQWQPFRFLIAKRCGGLYFPSNTGRDYFLKHWGAGFEEKMRTCYLGSTLPNVGDSTDSDVLQLVSCSNIIPLKRIEKIIEGLALLPESVRVEWNHFGEGSERQNMEALAREKLPGNIRWTFRGYVQNRELPALYRQLGAELFITTSSTEGLPVSLMEAFSLGMPVIATAVGGIPEMVFTGKTGYLLPEDVKAEEVCRAILDYLSLTADRRREMSDAARQLWQEEFDAQKNAEEFVLILRQILCE